MSGDTISVAGLISLSYTYAEKAMPGEVCAVSRSVVHTSYDSRATITRLEHLVNLRRVFYQLKNSKIMLDKDTYHEVILSCHTVNSV